MVTKNGEKINMNHNKKSFDDYYHLFVIDFYFMTETVKIGDPGWLG